MCIHAVVLCNVPSLSKVRPPCSHAHCARMPTAQVGLLSRQRTSNQMEADDDAASSAPAAARLSSPRAPISLKTAVSLASSARGAAASSAHPPAANLHGGLTDVGGERSLAEGSASSYRAAARRFSSATSRMRFVRSSQRPASPAHPPPRRPVPPRGQKNDSEPHTQFNLKSSSEENFQKTNQKTDISLHRGEWLSSFYTYIYISIEQGLPPR